VGLPTVSLGWDYSKINTREVYSTVNDQGGFLLFTWWRYLIDTLGWTAKYTCDGTTGPTSSSDHTDRLTTKAKCTTRGANASSAQSFGVVTTPDGVDVLCAYVGASDDILKFAMAQAGDYLPAGTATFTPTSALGETIGSTAITVIGTIGAFDRVYQLVGTTDKKNYRLWIYSQGALQSEHFFENPVSSINPAFGWTKPYLIGNRGPLTFANNGSAGGGSTGGSSGSTGGQSHRAIRIGSTNIAADGGALKYKQLANPFSVDSPELNGGAPIAPLVYSSIVAGFQGQIANAVDAWIPYSTNIVDGNPFGGNPSFQFQYFNTRLVPWDSVNASVLT
jgi:hypothetical protein